MSHNTFIPASGAVCSQFSVKLPCSNSDGVLWFSSLLYTVVILFVMNVDGIVLCGAGARCVEVGVCCMLTGPKYSVKLVSSVSAVISTITCPPCRSVPLLPSLPPTHGYIFRVFGLNSCDPPGAIHPVLGRSSPVTRPMFPRALAAPLPPVALAP